MTDEEVNRVIAEFMSLEYCGQGICFDVLTDPENPERCKCYYTRSLDALTLVWDKLATYKSNKYDGVALFYHGQQGLSSTAFFIDEYEGIEIYHDEEGHKTIQQAAAYTTAKAILRLKK